MPGHCRRRRRRPWPLRMSAKVSPCPRARGRPSRYLWRPSGWRSAPAGSARPRGRASATGVADISAQAPSGTARRGHPAPRRSAGSWPVPRRRWRWPRPRLDVRRTRRARQGGRAAKVGGLGGGFGHGHGRVSFASGIIGVLRRLWIIKAPKAADCNARTRPRFLRERAKISAGSLLVAADEHVGQRPTTKMTMVVKNQAGTQAVDLVAVVVETGAAPQPTKAATIRPFCTTSRKRPRVRNGHRRGEEGEDRAAPGCVGEAEHQPGEHQRLPVRSICDAGARSGEATQSPSSCDQARSSMNSDHGRFYLDVDVDVSAKMRNDERR